MGKTTDLFKKIGDIKGTSQSRMGTIKDRNSKNLTEVEEIKKRWQEYKIYTKKKKKRALMTWITTVVWTFI